MKQDLLEKKVMQFLKNAVFKKQDLLSQESLIEDAKIKKRVLFVENLVKKGKINLNVDFCIALFRHMNRIYNSRNVSGTGIGKLGCFLSGYALTCGGVHKIAEKIYPPHTGGRSSVCPQNEWYNHVLGVIFDETPRVLCVPNVKKNLYRCDLVQTKVKE